SYPEMCQAYKAHPIHLNGNSVVDSPSMFSRRVVEITASGSTVLSSAGRGVDETLAGTVPTVTTPDEAAAYLEGWKSSEQRRHAGL
ncbi:glycosyltransferase, partial [Lactobacillus mulieris]